MSAERDIVEVVLGIVREAESENLRNPTCATAQIDDTPAVTMEAVKRDIRKAIEAHVLGAKTARLQRLEKAAVALLSEGIDAFDPWFWEDLARAVNGEWSRCPERHPTQMQAMGVLQECELRMGHEGNCLGGMFTWSNPRPSTPPTNPQPPSGGSIPRP